MKSPFPGMDPYLEARWSDVHVKLIAYIAEALQPLLPRALRARSEERVVLEAVGDEDDEDGGPAQSYRSDVAVVDLGHGPSGRSAAASAATVPEPTIIELEDAPEVERSVQIIDTTSGNRVVTAIEVLSPWNKAPGALNRRYLKKLRDYARARVNVVELDLLRTPRDRLLYTEADLPPSRRTPYFVGIRRGGEPRRWTVYSLGLRHPLPDIPVPLRSSDADVLLSLQPLIERVYTAGGHDDIDYRNPPKPPLEPDDAAWAESLLKSVTR